MKLNGIMAVFGAAVIAAFVAGCGDPTDSQGANANNPKPQAPSQQTPSQQAPSQQAPVSQAPSAQAPVSQASGSQTPSQQPASVKVETTQIIDGKAKKVVETASAKRSDARKPLEPNATRRLHNGPVVISSMFEASGKGEHASSGKAIRGSYYYTTTVIAQSEVIKKEEDKGSGSVHVVERRKFLQARDQIALSDLDVVIALDTLPVAQVRTWVNNACTVVAGACMTVTKAVPAATPIAAAVNAGVAAVQATVSGAFDALHKIDGASARGLLGNFGVQVPGNVEVFVNKWMSKLAKKGLDKVHMALQSIEGKSFLITYTQDAEGKPLNVDYANEDGTPITDAEWEILRNANVFLDSNVVPDKRCRVGDAWMVWADDVQELFGSAGNGRADGKIRVERVADQPDGSWTLKIEPQEIAFRSKDDTIKGKMQVKEGNGLVDAENVSVKVLHATASGNLKSLSKERHLLFFEFVTRIDGDSNLRFSLESSPAK